MKLRTIVGEPYFTPGVPLVLDHKGLGDTRPGDLAIVRPGRGRARVERGLGSAKRIENVLEALLVEQGARVDFEPHTVPDGLRPLGSRVDLRELPTYTIDPDTAKDFDDALSFRREPGGIRAWVHIADVSYFVPAGSPLDHGASGRAFSTYVPGLVAPTSFITSISRRREKIESRIVFAISSVAAISSTIVAIVKIASITCATCSTRLDSRLPSMMRSTPAGGGRRLCAISGMYSALTGTTSNESGSGFHGRSAVSSGCSFFIRLNASSFEMKFAALICGFDCSSRATAFSC